MLILALQLWHWIAVPSADMTLLGQIFTVLFGCTLVAGLTILFPRSWLRILGLTTAASATLLILALISRVLGRDPVSIWNTISFTNIVIFTVMTGALFVALTVQRHRGLTRQNPKPYKTRNKVWIATDPATAYDAIHMQETSDPLDKSLHRIDADDMDPNRFHAIMKSPFNQDDLPDDGFGYWVKVTETVPGVSETRTIFTDNNDMPAEALQLSFTAKSNGTTLRIRSEANNVPTQQRLEMWLCDYAADHYHYMKEYTEGAKNPVAIKAIPYH